MTKFLFGSNHNLHLILSIILILLAATIPTILGDDRNLSDNNDNTNYYDNGNYALTSLAHKSLIIAAGCFWCAEQAYEQYAPGVIEVVSGYAGSDGIDFPTYKNHPGHYEVVLIEYDPNRTSYELLLRYAWRNIDPFDAYGQFCDRGFSYQSALFYANEEEKLIAQQVRQDVLDLHPNWDNASVVVPLLERPFFWRAENYHQDYYIKNPWNYGYYKERCGRTKRLKEVWGDEQYYCYHDLELSCFNNTAVNEDGMSIEAIVNVKNAPEESGRVRGAPVWGIIVMVVIAMCVGSLVVVGFMTSRWKKKSAIDKEGKEHSETEQEADVAPTDLA